MLYSTQCRVLAKKYGYLKAVRMLSDAGFPAIDVSADLLSSDIYTNEYKNLAREMLAIAAEKGVVFNQAHAPYSGNYERDAVPYIPRVLEFAGLLSIKTVVVHPFHEVDYRGNEEALFEKNMEFYSSLVPYARDAGVKIGLENMWQNHPITKRIRDDVCAPPEELCRYYDALADTGCFTVCLDLGHVALCGREPEDAIRIIGRERLGALHVHDNDYISDMHTLPGCGKISFDNVCRALSDIDYKGDLTLEADGFLDSICEGIGDDILPEAISFMKKRAQSLAERIDSYRVSSV